MRNIDFKLFILLWTFIHTKYFMYLFKRSSFPIFEQRYQNRRNKRGLIFILTNVLFSRLTLFTLVSFFSKIYFGRAYYFHYYIKCLSLQNVTLMPQFGLSSVFRILVCIRWLGLVYYVWLPYYSYKCHTRKYYNFLHYIAFGALF